MKHLLEPFIDKAIFKEVPDDMFISYFDVNDEHIADIYLNEQKTDWSSIVFHHEAEINDAELTVEQLQPYITAAEKYFVGEHYKLDIIQQYDEVYIAHYNYFEPKYNLYVHGAGMNLVFNFTGRLQEVSRGEAEIVVDYPEHLISKEEARAILADHQIVKKNILPEANWRYCYSTNYYFNGILPNGEIQHIHDLPEMEGASFEPLPNVLAINDFENYVRGGRREELHYNELNGIKFWQIDLEEIDIALPEDGFTRACRVVKALTGDEYESYYIERLPNFLATDDDEIEQIYYRFIYVLEEEDISFDFFPIVVSIDSKTNQILSVEMHDLPYEKIHSAKQPTLTLQQANDIAQQHADVELSLIRDFNHFNHYSFMYTLDYPNSPTGGFLYYVDGDTGKVIFVKTEK